MTLKYESEILIDLMKRDGDDAPSDVLPYESELKEKYLEQVEGAYPKLQDYRPEWLYYNLYHHIPSDFPVESVANVTNATFENVVPYAYKSAILKGQTLINLSPFTRNNGVYELNTSTHTSSHVLPMKLQQNKRYIFIFKLTNSQSSENSNYIVCRGLLTDGVFKEFGRKTQILPNGRHWFMLSSNEGDIDSIFVGTNFDVTLSDTMIIEYQDGMENWDIPYFEGMTSVKMPVLTTSNEDGTKTNILTVNEEVELRGIGEVKDELNLLTGELVQKTEKIIFDGSEAWEVISSLEKDNTIFAQCYKYTRNNTNTISNILDYISSLDTLDKRGFRFNHFFQIRLNKNEISNNTNNGVKEWVSKNNIIVVRVEEQTVKTVDVTDTDQDGNTVSIIRPIEGTMHVSTSSQTLTPLLDMSVPVEATTQNLMSFANIVEEEK